VTNNIAAESRGTEEVEGNGSKKTVEKKSSKNIVTKNVKERLAGTLSQSKREEEEG
jgi:hypothetical protein